jgi:hypothetical protein
MVPSRHAQIGDRMVAPRVLHLPAHMDSAATAHQEVPGSSVKTITEDRCTIGQPENRASILAFASMALRTVCFSGCWSLLDAYDRFGLCFSVLVTKWKLPLDS